MDAGKSSLHPNLVIGSLQLLGWLFLRSSAWSAHITAIDSSLSPHFCLAELKWRHWRNPALRQILVRGYLVSSLMAGGLLTLGLGLSGRLNPVGLMGFVFGLSIGLSFGVVVSAAVGIAVTVITSTVFGLIWSTPDILIIDMVLGLRFALVFGLTSAVAIHITGNLSGPNFRRSPEIQMGSFIIAFIISITIGTLFIGIAALIIQGRRAGWVADYGTALVVGGLPGVSIGLATGWRTLSWRRGVVTGVILFLLAVFMLGDVGREYGRDPGGDLLLRSFSLMTGLTYLTLFLLPYVVVERIIGPWAGTVAGAIGGLAVHLMFHFFSSLYALGPNLYLGMVFVLLGLTMSWWRPGLFYPFEAAWNTLLYRIDERCTGQGLSLLRWHSVFWDELQRLRLLGLDDYLVLVYERNPDEGRAAIEAVSMSRQRWAAQTAQIELDVRQLQQYSSVSEIATAHTRLPAGELEGAASAFLRSLTAISQDVAAALAQLSPYNQRLVFGEVEEKLNSLYREIIRSDVPAAARFLPVVIDWLKLVESHANQLAKLAEMHQEIQNPYVVGVPLTRRLEIFVGRGDISARIEELLRDQDHPPLLLYGQRRMGKTSLLNQLKWLLPQRIVPLVVDLQGPVALASDHAGFLYNLAKGMTVSARQQKLELPPLTRDTLAIDPFTIFDDWLDQVESNLLGQGRSTILLALDEFEALDAALTKGQLQEEAVLGMLRHIIQYRLPFKMLLAGSHTLDEFRRWASYLINAQVIHLGYFREDEARRLIEQPIQDFALSYEARASQRVLDLTRGHPYLVQLLCSEIVRLKNEQNLDERHRARLNDVETAVPEMLKTGSQFFADIEANQIDKMGLALLRFLAQRGEGQGYNRDELSRYITDTVQLDSSLTLLTRRELIEEIHGTYRFQVEVIRRWFAQ